MKWEERIKELVKEEEKKDKIKLLNQDQINQLKTLKIAEKLMDKNPEVTESNLTGMLMIYGKNDNIDNNKVKNKIISMSSKNELELMNKILEDSNTVNITSQNSTRKREIDNEILDLTFTNLVKEKGYKPVHQNNVNVKLINNYLISLGLHYGKGYILQHIQKFYK